MSNRAKQIDVVLAGFRDVLTDNVLSGGSVEFYESGTSTPKNAWNDATKTVAVTSITLDADGKKLVYGEGIYKLIVKDSVGSSKYTLDPIKVEHPNVNVVSKTSSYTATIDDDFILVDTGAGDVTITLPPASTMTHFIAIQKTSSDGNSVIVDPSGSELINGEATKSLTEPYSNYFIFSNGANVYGSGSYADNADTIDLIHASATPVANELLALDSSSKFPNSTLYTGSGNGLDADTLDTLHLTDLDTRYDERYGNISVVVEGSVVIAANGTSTVTLHSGQSHHLYAISVYSPSISMLHYGDTNAVSTGYATIVETSGSTVLSIRASTDTSRTYYYKVWELV